MYSKRDIGCYADGALGHDHARKVLADLLEANRWRDINHPGNLAHLDELIETLRGEMSDDDSETTDALEYLNTYCCMPGISFEFVDGELFLLGAQHDPEAEA